MFQELLEKVASALDERGIPYMVIGGQAVLIYGEPRLTRDIDVTLGVNVDKLEELRCLAAALGLAALVDDPETFVRETMVYPVFDDSSGIRVDFIFSYSSYERQAIARARDVPLGRTMVRFAAVEDVIIHKVVAGRARDMEDVVSILLKNTICDAGYIEKWLAEFDATLGHDYQARFRELKEQAES